MGHPIFRHRPPAKGGFGAPIKASKKAPHHPPQRLQGHRPRRRSRPQTDQALPHQAGPGQEGPGQVGVEDHRQGSGVQDDNGEGAGNTDPGDQSHDDPEDSSEGAGNADPHHESRHGLEGPGHEQHQALSGRVPGCARLRRATRSPPPRRRRRLGHRDPDAARPRVAQHVAGLHRRHRQPDSPGGPGNPHLPNFPETQPPTPRPWTATYGGRCNLLQK
jgi:hypothetical protein